MHNARLLDHFQNPRHGGEIPDANAIAEFSNPVCGDILKLWARVAEGRIMDIGFKCRGCVASMACGSALAEITVGKTVEAAKETTPADVEQAVGGLETASKHAAVLAVDTLRRLLDNSVGRA